jgi:hypothetical protein
MRVGERTLHRRQNINFFRRLAIVLAVQIAAKSPEKLDLALLNR